MAYRKYADFEKMVCEAVLRRDLTNVPTTYYLGIGSGALPAKGSTLSAILEVSGGGYSRKAITANSTGFPTLALAAGDWKISSQLVQWVATANWTNFCDYVFLTDVASGTSGRLFAAITFPEGSFQMLDDDTYDGTFEYQDI